MTKNLSISFIIPMLNSERHVPGCLEHIAAEMADGDEIVAVDNGSTDATLGILRDFGDVEILVHPEITIGALRNRGAAAARGDVLAFIDSDCLVAPGWRQAVSEMLADPTVAVTGAHYDMSPSPTWVEASWYASPERGIKEDTWLPSGNLVVRREVFEAVSGFDEGLVTDEDCDLGHRMTAAGFRIVENPAVRVIHLGNVKTIPELFRKTLWHSTGLFRSGLLVLDDRVMLMAYAFFLSSIAAVVAAFAPIDLFARILAVLGLVSWVPLAAGAYKALELRRPALLPPLSVLYAVLFVARGGAMWSELRRRLRGDARR